MSLPITVFILSWISIYYFIQLARKKNIQNLPTDRGLHSVPTPRGGGIVIVIAASIFISYVIFKDQDPAPSLLFILLGSILVAIVGFLDDLSGVTYKKRLFVHFASSILCVFPLYKSYFYFFDNQIAITLAVVLFLAFVCSWSINLFNFMDGSNGLAAMQAIFTTLFLAREQFLSGNELNTNIFLVLAATSAAFLSWNLSPSRIFMGDVGSGYLGYILFALSLYCSVTAGLDFAIAIMLMNTFWLDASLTLLIRLIKRKKLTEAHRDHLYQRLVLKYKSHNKTLTIYSLYNFTWITFCVQFYKKYPQFNVLIFLLSILPFISFYVFYSLKNNEK